ncbi:MAG: hypothetical protein ACFFEF_02435 [Candidatus Thorarchaeota archaeon]
MNSSWWIVGIAVLIFYIWGALKDKDKTIRGVKKSGKFVVKSMPLFFLAVLLIGFMKEVLFPDEQTVLNIFGNADIGIFWATLLGFVLPGPRYAIYPLAEFILMAGGGVGSVMALIAAQQLIDVPEGCFIEIKYLSSKFFLARLVIAILTTIVAAYLAILVNSFYPLWTAPPG